MSNILLLASDVHGSIEALSLLEQRGREHQVESILIAGDLCPSGHTHFQILLRNIPHLLLVRGNCDSSYDFSNEGIPLPPQKRCIEWQGRTIFMTHGDRIHSPFGQNLKDGDIFISGHTHTPKLQRGEDGIIWVNPGSTTYPRTPLGPTYALIDEESISIRSLTGDQPIAGLQYYFLPRADQ
ncbi:YfcE family phosphodiesterase [uncultured Sphaerochaeta sp.]|uniref:YfcE family phosphodiesterase n=1 Tax=uncultured Sphaerochaeta sp. TaxID=886478 RepID=UPI0029C9F640|nr:YfcE family phosphodiesterase [uncultured Sphaerochaeta sp.]